MATLTPARRDHLLLGAPLVAYAVIWFAILSAEAHNHWLLALCTTAAYVGGHVFEITRRGHWLLSADATAAPASLVVFALGLALLWYSGADPVLLLVNNVLAYGSAFLLGHVVAHACVFALDHLLPTAAGEE